MNIDGAWPPKGVQVEIAADALGHLRDYLAQHPGMDRVRLRAGEDTDGCVLVIPRPAAELLAEVLSHFASGDGVSVLSSRAELTTQQAADLLNVSRPFLIGLLNASEIEYRMVGSHRRVAVGSLMDYRARDETLRRHAADELSAATQDLNLTG
jgi:excisionase family DNA binding protein